MRKILLAIILLIIGSGAGFLYLRGTYKSFNLPSKAPAPVVSPGTLDSDGDEAPSSQPAIQSSAFEMPAGFDISVFASGLTNARVMAVGPGGVLLVSQPSEGQVVALPDKNGDNIADEEIVAASGLNRPHGIAFRCRNPEVPDNCALYIAETNQLSEFVYNPATYKASNKKKLADLPAGGGGHYTRTLLFMPVPDEDILLVSVGSSCNVCLESDDRRAKILAYDTSSGKMEEFARGLRNAVFMELHPVTGKVWVTEMGRDGLGDDVPPDEINIVEQGKNYGWPICYGKNIHDNNFDKNTYIRNPCMEPFETPSYIDLQAHSAPLGLSFFPEEGWPEEYWHDMLIAYHGSWNRSVPTGYKIVRVSLNPDGSFSSKAPLIEDFITGWLREDGKRIGRPADIKIFPGGQIYISDDQAGIIYRVIRK